MSSTRAKSPEGAAYHAHEILTREELAALMAASASLETRDSRTLRETAARLLKQLAERIAGQKLS